MKIHKYIKYVMFNLNFLSSVMFYTLFSINRTPLCFVGGVDGLIGAERERERDHLLAKGGNSDCTFPQYLNDI